MKNQWPSLQWHAYRDSSFIDLGFEGPSPPYSFPHSKLVNFVLVKKVLVKIIQMGQKRLPALGQH